LCDLGIEIFFDLWLVDLGDLSQKHFRVWRDLGSLWLSHSYNLGLWDFFALGLRDLTVLRLSHFNFLILGDYNSLLFVH
jgi:hypothetical protein